MPRICDYEGSRYRTDFWEGQNRTYEDRTERAAMRKLLPSQGKRLIEIGAGFGRLADLYQGYHQVVLLDYARTQLEQARDLLGHDDRFIYVVADVYKLPFVDDVFDAVTMVRVMHHLVEVPMALQELHRIIAPTGTAVIEHASKSHLKAIIRWLLRRQPWSPFDPTPTEFVDLNFNFHPAWMRQQFELAGFCIQKTRALSYYRLDLLKRLLPTPLLVTLDEWTQPTGNWWQLAPSLFLQAGVDKPESSPSDEFFRCPICKSPELVRLGLKSGDTSLTCQGCQRRWSYSGGIYDFKTSL